MREELEKFNEMLNEDPLLDLDGNGKPRYIKERAVGGGKKSKYIVHTRRDYLLHKFYDFHEFEIIKETILTKERNFRGRDGKTEIRNVTEYIVSVKLNVLHPVLNKIVTYPGIGSASDNGVNTMQSVAPSALEFARSNATKKIGRIFGAYLNKDEDEAFPEIPLEDKIAAMKTILSGKFESLNELENAVQLDNNDILNNSPELQQLFNQAKAKIKEKLKWKAEYNEFMKTLPDRVNACGTEGELKILFLSLKKSEQKWAAKMITEKKQQLNGGVQKEDS